MTEKYNSLLHSVSEIEQVESIGKTGKIEISINNENDIDIFIFCKNTPDFEVRKEAYKKIDEKMIVKMHDFEGKFWGTLDILKIDGLEICLMYFTIEKTEDEINDILKGNRIKKEDNYFFPIGRCSTIKNINILYEKNNFLKNMKEKLSVYPDELYNKNIEYHVSKLNDREDIERAISLEDVLFYHNALDISLEHFLQLLFTKNKCFFSSRKRNALLMEEMKIRPNNCIERLFEIIELGGNVKTITKSYEKWKKLIKELIEL